MLGLPSQHPIGAVCGSAARTDLAGGRWVTIVPTGTSEELAIIIQSFNDIIEEINDVNCVAYGVDQITVERYVEAKQLAKGSKS